MKILFVSAVFFMATCILNAQDVKVEKMRPLKKEVKEQTTQEKAILKNNENMITNEMLENPAPVEKVEKAKVLEAEPKNMLKTNKNNVKTPEKK